MADTPLHPLLACFAFLEREAGFALAGFTDAPAAFDNCVAHYVRPGGSAPLELRIERDRGQVFVEMRRGSTAWQDKDALLEGLGVARSRHAIGPDGSWSGYHMAVQASDLQQHLPLLAQHLGNDRN